MAEGDGAQNQGQQGQSGSFDPSKEVKSEVVDQAKLDRAAKERERRRRRRRKKAELKRLERETLQQSGALPKLETTKPAEIGKKDAGSLKKKPEVKPESPDSGPKPSVEHHIAKRSEEHAPRSKVIVPQAKQKEDEQQKPIQKPIEKPDQKSEESLNEPHPMSHKTHSFAGPLIEPVGQQPEPKPELPTQEFGAVPEPHAEKQIESKPAVQPEPVVQPQPEVQPQPVPETESEPQDVNLEDLPPIFPVHDEESDIVINDQHKEVRPPVNMEEVHADKENENELPPIFPYPQPSEEKKVLDAEPEAEEIKPVKKVRKVEEKEHSVEKQESSKETMSESEGLNVKKSFLQAAGGFSAGVLQSVGKAFHQFRLKFDVKKLGVFLVLMVIGGGLYAGYLFKVHETVYNSVAGLFKAPPPVEVQLDEQLLREWGITTALLFGDNRGSTKDLFASQLFNAYYFGYLSEPRVEGETGITPAYYYGKGEDLVAATNRFIAYVKNLRELVSVYDVDVYQMLDQTTEREKAMNAHVAKLKEVQEKSTAMLKEINTEIDDLKISLESLNPEKTRSETDFFVALQGLAGEKSDFLLKSFIDISQKQTALKAHLAALQKLSGYYDSSLQKLAIRITAIEKNYQVLVQGIRVVDIPGANLDIIIKETP